MDQSIYDQYCGRCVHAELTQRQGTTCGLTQSKPDLENGCPDLVIDVTLENGLAERAERWEKIQERDGDQFQNQELQDMISDGDFSDDKGRFRWKGLLAPLSDDIAGDNFKRHQIENHRT